MDPQHQKNVHGIAIRIIIQPSDASFYVQGTSTISNHNIRTEDRIQCEIEKLRIWDDIIEREVAYKRVLEAELRREILLEELALQRPARISSSSMLMSTSHHHGDFGWELDQRKHLEATTIDTTLLPKRKLLGLPQEVHLSSGTKRKREATQQKNPVSLPLLVIKIRRKNYRGSRENGLAISAKFEKSFEGEEACGQGKKRKKMQEEDKEDSKQISNVA